MFIADCVNDGKVTDVAPKHLVQETKTQRLLTPDDTTTGLNKRVLGLKRGYLTQGRRYIVQVDVTHKGNTDAAAIVNSSFKAGVTLCSII